MKMSNEEIEIMQFLYEVLLKEQEMNLKIRNPRGYGWSHTYVENTPKPGYGEVSLDKEEQKEEPKMPVKISKAFKERRNEVD